MFFEKIINHYKQEKKKLGCCFGEFFLDSGEKLFVYDQYRNSVKGGWKRWNWYLTGIFLIRENLVRDSEVERLCSELETSRTTWPAEPKVFAKTLHDLAAQYPDELKVLPDVCKETGMPIIAARLKPEAYDRMFYSYQSAAQMIDGYLKREGLKQQEKSRVLEVGSGMGYLVGCLRTMGWENTIGVDFTADDPLRTTYEKPEMLRRIFRSKEKLSEKPVAVVGNATQIENESDSLDAIYSVSVLEHIWDIPHALSEMHRVLKRGGIMVHSFDHWYGFGGGHSVCTLDTPFGHGIVNRSEFMRYVKQFRPCETDVAMQMYDNEFTRPRYTICEMEKMCQTVGFKTKIELSSGKKKHLPLIGDFRQNFKKLKERHPLVSKQEAISRNAMLICSKR